MTFEMIDGRQLKAMEAIGRMRIQAIGWSFAITMGLVFAIAALTGFRITFGLIAWISLGGIVSKLHVCRGASRIGIGPRRQEQHRVLAWHRESRTRFDRARAPNCL